MVNQNLILQHLLRIIFSSTHFNSVYCAPPFPSLKPLPMTTLLLKSVIFHATLKLYQVSMCPLLLEFHTLHIFEYNLKQK